MSVILDALKRVQDENRRRDVAPEAGETASSQGSNALLRRLAAPRSTPSKGAPRTDFTRVMWVAVAGLAVVLIAAFAMWWLQPTIGPRVSDDRPLLSTMGTQSSGSEPQQPATNPNGGDITETFGGGPETNWPADGDMSDLSANLPEESAPGGSLPEGSEGRADEGAMHFEVASQGGGASSNEGGSRLDLSSDRSTGALQSPWVPASPTGNTSSMPEPPAEIGRARPPNRLVDPGVKAAFNEGVRFQKAGQFAEAEEAYKRALKHDVNNARVNANLGVLYESQGRFDLAERHLRQAIHVESENANFRNNLGVVLYRVGDYEGAMAEFNRTLRYDPTRLDAHTNRGLIHTRWGRFEEAESSFRAVLSLDPNNALAHYNLGLVYEETDRLQGALDEYYEFIRVGGADHPEIVNYLEGHLIWLEGRLNGNGGSHR